MNAPDVSSSTKPVEIDTAQAQEVGGGDLCSGAQLQELTAALKQSYDNLVDFTSYVIERVAGS